MAATSVSWAAPTCGAAPVSVMLMPNQSSPTAPLPCPGTNERTNEVNPSTLQNWPRPSRVGGGVVVGGGGGRPRLPRLPPSLPRHHRHSHARYSFSHPLLPSPSPAPVPAPCASRASEHGGTREGGRERRKKEREREGNLSLSRRFAPRRPPFAPSLLIIE